jgi:hypothetical protein
MAGALVGVFLVLGCVFIIALGIAIYLLYLVYTCHARLPSKYRRMEPGMVFLILIPLFNLYWQFPVYVGLSEAYKNYFRSRGRDDVGDCGYGLAMVLCILQVVLFVTVPLAAVQNVFVQYVRGALGLSVFVMMIVYLVKMVGLRNQIGGTSGKSRRSRRYDDEDDYDDDYDDEDDRPRKRLGSKKDRYDDEDDEDVPPKKQSGITADPGKTSKKKRYDDEDEDEEDDRPRRRK